MVKKSKIFSIIMIFLLLVGMTSLIVISIANDGAMNGFQTSSVSCNVTYKSGSADIATGFDFKYDNVKKESIFLNAELSSGSELAVSDFSATSECRISIYQNDILLWSEVIKNNTVYTDLVIQDGQYEVVLEMDTGKGSGTIEII